MTDAAQQLRGGYRLIGLRAALLLAPLSLFAEFLIVRTHHRPLGAATFATGAIILWALGDVLAKYSQAQQHGRAPLGTVVPVLSIVSAAVVLVRAALAVVGQNSG